MANQILGADQSDKQRNTGALIIKVHNELVMPLCENSGLLKKNIAINTGIVFQRKKVSFQALTNCFVTSKLTILETQLTCNCKIITDSIYGVLGRNINYHLLWRIEHNSKTILC